MSRQAIALLTLPVIATAAVVAETFVRLTGATAAAAGNTFGVARSDAAIGDTFPADVIGTAIVTAGAAIAKDALIEVGAAGKAVTKAAGIAVARALEAAAADGDKLEVLLIAN